MREHPQSRILISLLLGLILLALCLPVCAFAEDTEFSDGDEAGISLVTTVPPSVISGAGAAYQKGSASGLTFKTDDEKDNLLRVLVDGQVISPDKYTVSGEPLTITLHAAYLDTLSAGEHTIEIVTTNGNAVAKFRIKNNSSDSSADDNETPGRQEVQNSPHTGDISQIELWSLMMVISATALIVCFATRKRHSG